MHYHHFAHSFTHAVVRGAGYEAGRQVTRAFMHTFGFLGLIILIVIVAATSGSRRP